MYNSVNINQALLDLLQMALLARKLFGVARKVISCNISLFFCQGELFKSRKKESQICICSSAPSMLW